MGACIVLGCAGPSRSIEAINTRPHRDLTAALIAPTGTLQLADCGMYAGTRRGFCIVTGPGNDIETLVQTSLQTAPVQSSTEFGEHSCAANPAFGVPGTYGYLLKATAQRMDVTRNLPNHDNAHLRAVTFDPTAGLLCLDFEYPYG